MNTLTANFNKAYPAYAATTFTGQHSVNEPNNASNGKFRELQIQGIDGYAFPHELAQKLSSFAQSAGNTGCLVEDCDGIVLFEHEGQKYILLSELKSTFSLDEIAKAKDQIIGSYLKMIGVLTILQGFNPEDYKAIGLVASFKPTDEQISAISKMEDVKATFAIDLIHKGVRIMPANRCQKFFSPLDVNEFPIYYVPVENRNPIHTVNIVSLLKK